MPRPRLYRVSALVLRQHHLGDADRLLTLLTRERGKLRAVAKGVRRPRSKLAAGTQLLCCSSLQLAAGANLDIVTQCEVRCAFHPLRDDLRRLSYASYFADLVDAFVEEHDGSEHIFDLLLGAVARAARACPSVALRAGSEPVEWGERLELLARVFELRLLGALGYAPELNHCIRCGGELTGEWVGFSPALGGAICPSCAGAEQAWERLSAGALRTARICARSSPRLLPRVRLSPAMSAELQHALRAYIEYHLGRRVRAGCFLEGLPALLAAMPGAGGAAGAND